MKLFSKLIFCVLFLFLFSCNAQEKHKIYTSIDDALKKPDEVYVLDLSNQDLKGLPLSLLKFVNLEELHLYGNDIDQIIYYHFIYLKLKE